MQTVTHKEGTTLTLAPIGRLDTATAPEFEQTLVLDGVTALVLDFARLDYISSAGLRLLVRAKKRVADITIAHASKAVREVFEIVGFSDSFRFEG